MLPIMHAGIVLGAFSYIIGGSLLLDIFLVDTRYAWSLTLIISRLFNTLRLCLCVQSHNLLHLPRQAGMPACTPNTVSQYSTNPTCTAEEFEGANAPQETYRVAQLLHAWMMVHVRVHRHLKFFLHKQSETSTARYFLPSCSYCSVCVSE